MKRGIQITVMLATILMIGVCNVHAAIDWDFYEDGIIQEGDDYANVRLFDTPPDHTTVDMTGGSAYNILTYNSSTLNVSGGQTEVFAYNESTINISGGTVYTLDGYNSSNVNIFGGSVNGVYSYDTSSVDVWGDADLNRLRARGQGVVNMSGGISDLVSAGDYGTVNLWGGTVLDSLAIGESGIINIYGFDLSKIATGGKFGHGSVWGEWQSGIIFNFDFYGSNTYQGVILHEIPEPSTLAIVMIGVLFLRKRTR